MPTLQLKKKKRIGDLAVELGFMTEAQKSNILAQKNISSRMLGQLCLSEGLIDDEQLAQLIAAQYDCGYARFDSAADPDLLALLSIDFIVKNRIIPFSRTDDDLVLAVADPIDFFPGGRRNGNSAAICVFLRGGQPPEAEYLYYKAGYIRDLLDVSEEMRLSVIKESDQGRV